MATVYIGIGSNLGDREKNCLRAVSLMALRGIDAVRSSHIYETEPWGVAGQQSFMNMAVRAETLLGPRELLGVLKDIERQMGREMGGPRWGPRVIDLDILLYGSLVLREPDLAIPHPLMHERGFVLDPLCEIAPGAVHPVLGKTIRELRKALGEA